MTIATIEALPVTEFLETEFERSLRQSLAPLAIEVGYGMTDHPWVSDFVGAAGPTADFLKAVASARALPKRLAGIWAEHQEWQALQAERAALAPGYYLPPHVAARVSALEHLMDTLPDPSPAGMKARFAWLHHLAKLDHYRTNVEDTDLAARIAADFDALMGSVQSGRRVAKPSPQPRTQADRRREVLAMLQSEPALSDREIGRRCDVSPQTVNNWRRKTASGV